MANTDLSTPPVGLTRRRTRTRAPDRAAQSPERGPEEPRPGETQDDAYTVGYGRPPLHTRVRPGQKLNPNGRPRGSKNTSTLVKEELDRKVAVREGGRVRKLSKRQAAIRNLSNKAAAGDAKALVTLVALEGGGGQRAPDNLRSEPALEARDQAILNDMRETMALALRREREAEQEG